MKNFLDYKNLKNNKFPLSQKYYMNSAFTPLEAALQVERRDTTPEDPKLSPYAQNSNESFDFCNISVSGHIPMNCFSNGGLLDGRIEESPNPQAVSNINFSPIFDQKTGMANMSNIISPIESGGTINHFGIDNSESRCSNKRVKKKKRNFWKQNSSSQGESANGLTSSLNKTSSRMRFKKFGRGKKEVNLQKKLNFETNKKFKCTCEKSLCKKKYCECFANGEKCLFGLCECIGCTNYKEDEGLTLDDHQNTLEMDKNVSNFAVSVETDLLQNVVNFPNAQEMDHCNCLHSSCLKNYCECLKAGRSCGNLCRCKECKNPHGGLKTLKSNYWLLEGYINMIRIFIEPGTIIVEESNACIEEEKRQLIIKHREEKERLEALLSRKNEEELIGRKRKKFLSFTGDIKEALKNEKKREKQNKKIKKKENKNLNKPKKSSKKLNERSLPNQQLVSKLNENLYYNNLNFEGQEAYQLPSYISTFLLPSTPNLRKPKYVKVSIVGTEKDKDNLSPMKITKKEEFTPLQTTAIATESRQPSEGFTSDPSKKTAQKKLDMQVFTKKEVSKKNGQIQIKQQEC